MQSSLYAASAAMLSFGYAVNAANLLTDPGFELNPLDTIANVLSDFTTYQNLWGPESSTIVGVDGGITPASGLNQMRMDWNGGVTTQTIQMVDVSSFAALIDAGNAQIVANALYNAAPNPGVVNGPTAGVYVNYFSAANFGSMIGPTDLSVFNLDLNPMSWEFNGVTATVPIGTRWVAFQVAYDNNSILGLSGGYVDDTFMEIRAIPAPGPIALSGAAGLVALRRRRR
ncbi:MAG: hypothetical protein KDA20_13100 [Phycisphaerales bacterium]|nr:hypothetical protein [Phycisphaerales bacterium]